MAGGSAEGVIRFELEHRTAPLEPRELAATAAVLAAWREVLARLRLVGRDPARYEGLGYGNLSARVGPFGDVGRGRRRFLVTGTQTGGRRHVTLTDFALVEQWDLVRNRVVSSGSLEPSSESLTHAAIYDIAPAARAVFHVHAPEIWRAAASLGIPVSRPEAQNGTTAMALEVQRLHRESTFASTGILAMGGHEDGVLAVGRTPPEAGEVLVRYFARALEAGAST